MKRLFKTAFLSLILTLFLGPVFQAGAAAEPRDLILRSAVVPDKGIWVGQQVRLQFDVLGKNGWAQIPSLPDIQVPGAVLISLESQGTRLNEVIDGESYTGQQYELSLFPQRNGRISIPPTTVDIQIRQWGSSIPDIQLIQGKLPAIHFNAKMPPGAENLRGVVSTTQLTARQTWNPDATEVTVGDAVLRRIHLKADGVSGMAFAPIRFAASDALDIYPKAPDVQDGYDRGTLTGERTETVSYVFINSGTVEVPAVTISWWDLNGRKLRTTTLPSRTIRVAPPAGTSGGPVKETGTDTRPAWFFIGLLSTVFLGMGLFGRRLLFFWRAWRERQKESEKAYFQRFRKAARSGTAADAFNSLMRWLDRINTGNRAARLDQFLAGYADRENEKEIERMLQSPVDSAQRRLEDRHVLETISRARKNWLQRHRMAKNPRQLPRLNPSDRSRV